MLNTSSVDTINAFREIWLADFEFRAPAGSRPHPICLVAKEFRSGRTIRLWEDELQCRRAPPFAVGPDSLYIAYLASAEIGCHLSLGWPIPERILDLYVEFRVISNGLQTPHGRGLIGALLWFGLDPLDVVEKVEMRDLAMRGGPWTDSERVALLAYCERDVLGLTRLLPAMLPSVDTGRALLRGRFMAAVARIERSGIPIDIITYSRFLANWEQLALTVIRESDVHDIYEGTTFRLYRFKEWLYERNMSWPFLDTGSLNLDADAFALMKEFEPTIRPIADLRDLLSQLHLPEKLSVGPDGRNRCLLSPFASRTSRNQPSGARFIFGAASWLRGLIRPEPGQALAYVDWSQQEFGIGAALSGDAAMASAYRSGDPYTEFGRQAGIIPKDGSREDFETERERCKRCILGTMYGLGPWGLARQIKSQPAHARELLELHRRTYQKYWEWSDGVEVLGMLGGQLQTVFGWPLRVGPNANPRSIRNFAIQGNAAECLRLACCLITESGVDVVAPVHDALMVEGPTDSINDIVARTQAAMQEAAEIVLGGFRLRTDVKIIHWPDRLLDAKKTQPMWDRVTNIVDAIERP